MNRSEGTTRLNVAIYIRLVRCVWSTYKFDSLDITVHLLSIVSAVWSDLKDPQNESCGCDGVIVIGVGISVSAR